MCSSDLTQHSVKMLQGLGISPDVIVMRSEHPVDQNIKKKISLFCDIDEEAVIESLDAESLYEIPLTMEKLGLADVICKHFKIRNEKPLLTEWTKMVEKFKNPKKIIKVAVKFVNTMGKRKSKKFKKIPKTKFTILIVKS